jgi:release factor glutamine methyltransferase
MSAESSVAPLVVRLQLTDEQQRLIRERTGLSIPAIPVETDAASIQFSFGGVELCIERGVFVPNPNTERLLRLAVDDASRHERPILVDVGTGSGAVALAAAARLPRATVFATDISTDALRCARQNRARLGALNVQFRLGSLLTPLPKRLRGAVTVMVANLPYLPPAATEAARHTFPQGTAIGLGEDGLGLPRRLALAARDFLAPGASLLMQLAGYQWPAFAQDLMSLGYSEPWLESAEQNAPVIGRVEWIPQSEDV